MSAPCQIDPMSGICHLQPPPPDTELKKINNVPALIFFNTIKMYLSIYNSILDRYLFESESLSAKIHQITQITTNLSVPSSL